MSVLIGDFTGCSVLLYDTKGKHLGSTTIIEHDRRDRQIEVEEIPSGLNINDTCRVFILTSPTPCEFSGKLKKVGSDLLIAMFQGQEKENRAATRYPVKTPARIEALIVDNKANELQEPIYVILINISTSGVRFRAPYFALIEGDIFRINLTINNTGKTMTAEVINSLDNGTKSSDYGCRFVEIL